MIKNFNLILIFGGFSLISPVLAEAGGQGCMAGYLFYPDMTSSKFQEYSGVGSFIVNRTYDEGKCVISQESKNKVDHYFKVRNIPNPFLKTGYSTWDTQSFLNLQEVSYTEDARVQKQQKTADQGHVRPPAEEKGECAYSCFLLLTTKGGQSGEVHIVNRKRDPESKRCIPQLDPIKKTSLLVKNLETQKDKVLVEDLVTSLKVLTKNPLVKKTKKCVQNPLSSITQWKKETQVKIESLGTYDSRKDQNQRLKDGTDPLSKFKDGQLR